jgi:N-acetylglucosaminyl-diphospho-decaprenol L-rhamnosyltransferase
MGIEVSIIIPNWNGGDVLTECLESILVHTQDTDFEIIIVDNGSTDSSPQFIRQLAESDDRVKPIFNRENLFFARACNQGFDISTGRYVIVGNNDIVLQDDAVKALVEYADAHPGVGAVTPRFCDRAGTPLEFFRRLPNVLFVIAHYHRLGRAIDRFLLGRRIQNAYFLRNRSFDRVEVVDQSGASFSLLRRRVIDATGMLFDERFPLLFNDVDLFHRIKRAGFASHVLPETYVIHLEGVSSQKLDPAIYDDLLYRGMFDYFKTHHPVQYPLLCLAWPWRWFRARRGNGTGTGVLST